MSIAYDITVFVEQRQILQDTVIAYIADQQYPLEQRWRIYYLACKASLLDLDSYITHIPALNNVSWYDDFYKDRYATVEWTDIVEQLDNTDDSSELYPYKLNLNTIKEQILAQGKAGFINDW